MYKKLIIIISAAIFATSVINYKYGGYFPSIVFYGNKEHYIGCDKLPSFMEANQIFLKHRKEAIEIASIGSTVISIDGSEMSVIEANKNAIDSYIGPNVSFRLSEVNEGDCKNRAQIEMTAGGTQDYEKIKQIVGDKFFGIPYRITNI